MSYQRASTENPLGFKPWRFAVSNSGLGLGDYVPHRGPFLPLTGLLARGTLGDYQTDPATLPPAPAGYQYNAQYELVPVQPGPNWVGIALVAGIGAAAWWYFSKRRGSVRLPLAI